jgi:putative toxin-antitoxin system antitoxin component (TIGR02293 family)
MSDYSAVAYALGVEDAASISPMDLARSVSAGLPKRALTLVADAVSPDDNGFRHRVVPRATAARNKSGLLSPAASERVARVARVWAEAVAVWGGDVAARGFLFRPHAMLENQAPMTVAIGSELGAELVCDILGRLRYGSAA